MAGIDDSAQDVGVIFSNPSACEKRRDGTMSIEHRERKFGIALDSGIETLPVTERNQFAECAYLEIVLDR